MVRRSTVQRALKAAAVAAAFVWLFVQTLAAVSMRSLPAHHAMIEALR